MVNLQVQFERNLQRYRFFFTDEVVIVAVSAGADSMALLMLMLQLPDAQRPRIIVAHVNHELRTQSEAEEQYLMEFCQQHELELEIAHWQKADHPTTGIEAAARDFRYHFFARLMHKYDANKLLTAHHLNDQAETYLMKLVRGGWIEQLEGIAVGRPFATGMLIRPLLHLKKAILVEFLQQSGVKFFEDATNHDLGITRNRYRHSIIPALEQENQRVLEHIQAYTEQLAELDEFAQLQAKKLLKTVTIDNKLVINQFKTLSKVEQLPVVKLWLLNQAHHHDVKRSQLEAILALLNGKTAQGEVQLSATRKVVKSYDEVLLQTETLDEIPIPPLSKLVSLEPIKGALEFWLDPNQLPLSIRKWRPDDKILLKSGHHQSVRRILIDNKVSQQQRQAQLVVVDVNDIPIWVVNQKPSYLVRPTDYQDNWQKVYFMRQLKDKHEGDKA